MEHKHAFHRLKVEWLRLGCDMTLAESQAKAELAEVVSEARRLYPALNQAAFASQVARLAGIKASV